VDLNGDGLMDFVTGKRWWSHGPEGAPDGDTPSPLYWFEGVRNEDGTAGFVPHLIDDDSGVGVQVIAGDVNGDGKVDVVVGNKKGAFVFLQEDEEEKVGFLPRDEDGNALNLDFETGDLTNWTVAGEAFAGQPVRDDRSAARGREPSLHQGEYWIGGWELAGDEATGTLTSAPFRVTQPWASFLVGGGAYEAIRLELHVEGGDPEKPFFTTSGTDYESMQRVVVDLRPQANQRIFVRINDRHTWGWGHLNFDDFRFHSRRPAFERPDHVPEIFRLDTVENAGLSPREAAAAMTVPAGFAVELIAGEPDLHQPIALTIDAKGRLWVVEAHTYPERAPDGDGKDEVIVLEDRDGDGAFESRTVFARGLNLVSGLEVGFGGVWIGAAPHLLFIPDRNDDLVPDGEPEVLLDGWGYQDTHETLNAFNWGPDGWLYGCHGVFTHSRVGRPGTPDESRVPINAGIWRFHPERHEFEVFAWGTSNPWGVDFDDNGQAFATACVIPHLFHLTQGGRYNRQAGNHFNPHVFADIVTVADHRHYLGNTPHGGNLRSNQAGGGHAHCGAMIYLGDAFPDEYRGTLFMNNIHGNRVNNDRLERSGSGFIGRHVDDFLLANDTWFRGINLRTGPDGAVYLIDWYDEQACHDKTPETWDRTNGRLYRVAYGEPRRVAVDLSALTGAELVRLQLHDNDWFVRRARMILQERGPDAAIHALLVEAFDATDEPTKQLRTIWALHATGGLDTARTLALLDSPHEYVRAWAIQLELETRPAGKELLEKLVALAGNDPSPVVRLYVASALQRLPLAQRWDIAAALASHAEDASDPNIPYLLWYGVEPLVPADPSRALALGRASRIELLTRFIARRAAVEAEHHDELVAAILAETEHERRSWMVAEMAVALRDERGVAVPAGWTALFPELVEDPDADVQELALELAVAFGDPAAFDRLRRVLADPDAPRAKRQRALDALVRGQDAASVGILQAVLVEPALRSQALRALASFDDTATPRSILAGYPGYDEGERRDALNTLSSRAPYARELLAAVGRGDIPSGDLGAFVLRQLRSLEDAEVDALVEESWGLVRAPGQDHTEATARLTALLTAERLERTDLPEGRDVFARTCAQCHVLFDVGGSVGPDLTGSNRSDLEYLLGNLIDPNELIGKDYRATNVWMQDGRLVTGIEKKRTESTITLQTENDLVTVALADVEEIQESPLSTMPEGLLDPLSEDEVADLVAYLRSTTQVPRLATPANVAGFFDGETLETWHGNRQVFRVEDGAIVGASAAGLSRNEFLRSDFELRDFRLKLEVKLEDDAGNSGIQFRSRELEHGEVQGYQADVGPGWWGKLYEEHGRGLIWEQGGEDVVVKGGWNEYEILAVGHTLKTWVNGKLCVDLVDPDGALSGVIAFQVHSCGATDVRFRNFQLELNPVLPGPDSSGGQ